MWLLMAMAGCPSNAPNSSGAAYFCIPGPATLYTEDDRAPLSRECAGTNTCGQQGGYGVPNVRGDFCACDHGEPAPHQFLRPVRDRVVCNASGPPLAATLLGTPYALRSATGSAAKLVSLLDRQHPTPVDRLYLDAGQCGATAPRCVGFYTEVVEAGVSTRLWGVCQATPTPAAPDDPFLHPVEAARAAERGKTPCNCMNQRPEWKSFRQKAGGEDVAHIYNRVTGTADPDGPCETVRVGWGWDGPPEADVDPVVLTIPPGPKESDPMEVVAKVGTAVPLPAHGRTVPCGVQEHHPLGSITLKEYCAIPPGTASLAAVTTYNESYNVEAAARIYAVRNLRSMQARYAAYLAEVDPRCTTAPRFLGMPVCVRGERATSVVALFADSMKTEPVSLRAQYKFVLGLLREDLRWGTAEILHSFPPSFHGSEEFPSHVDPEFHIGSRNFSLVTDRDGTVSPFRLLMYHFSTSVVDYGVLINTWNGSHADFGATGVLSHSGSFLGQTMRPDSTLSSGFHNYFMGLMPGVLGRLTLPLSRKAARDCHNPLLEKLKRQGNARAAGSMARPTVESACQIASALRVDHDLIQMIMAPDEARTFELYPFVPTMGWHDLNETYVLAAKVDALEQLFMVIRYAMPDVLTAAFYESVTSHAGAGAKRFFDDKRLERCQDPVYYRPQIGAACLKGGIPVVPNTVIPDLATVVERPEGPCVMDDIARGTAHFGAVPALLDTMRRNCTALAGCNSFCVIGRPARCPATLRRTNDTGPYTTGNLAWYSRHTSHPTASASDSHWTRLPQVAYIRRGTKSTFRNCTAGLTDLVENNTSIYAADPSWSPMMWQPHDGSVWATLCTTLNVPVPGIAFPEEARTLYEADGCDLSSVDALFGSADPGPLDLFDDRHGCQVPVILPFSLHRTSRLPAITRPVSMSEAVATAAWPGLPIERILQYTGGLAGHRPRREAATPGNCTALDPWYEASASPDSNHEHARRRACTTAELQSVTLFNATRKCVVPCAGVAVCSDHADLAAICLAVDGFGRSSLPAHGMGNVSMGRTAFKEAVEAAVDELNDVVAWNRSLPWSGGCRATSDHHCPDEADPEAPCLAICSDADCALETVTEFARPSVQAAGEALFARMEADAESVGVYLGGTTPSSLTYRTMFGNMRERWWRFWVALPAMYEETDYGEEGSNCEVPDTGYEYRIVEGSWEPWQPTTAAECAALHLYMIETLWPDDQPHWADWLPSDHSTVSWQEKPLFAWGMYQEGGSWKCTCRYISSVCRIGRVPNSTKNLRVYQIIPLPKQQQILRTYRARKNPAAWQVSVQECVAYLNDTDPLPQHDADLHLYFRRLSATNLNISSARHAAVGLHAGYDAMMAEHWPDGDQFVPPDRHDIHYNWLVSDVLRDIDQMLDFGQALGKPTDWTPANEDGRTGVYWAKLTYMRRRMLAGLTATNSSNDAKLLLLNPGNNMHDSTDGDENSTTFSINVFQILCLAETFKESSSGIHSGADDWEKKRGLLPNTYMRLGSRWSWPNADQPAGRDNWGTFYRKTGDYQDRYPKHTFYQFGLIQHSSITPSSPCTNGNPSCLAEDVDLASNNSQTGRSVCDTARMVTPSLWAPVPHVQLLALNEFLLRAHVRRGTALPHLLRSKTLSPVVGCTASTNHYPEAATKSGTLEGKPWRDGEVPSECQCWQDSNGDCSESERDTRFHPKCALEKAVGMLGMAGDYLAYPTKDAQANAGEAGVLPSPMRAIPLGTPALRVGHTEASSSQLHPLLFDRDVWRQLPDYSTLRAGTTVGKPIRPMPADHAQPPADTPKYPPDGQKYDARNRMLHYYESALQLMANTTAALPHCHFNRCASAMSRVHVAGGIHLVSLDDVETFAGSCYPGQTTPDSATTALYRRRHFAVFRASELLAMGTKPGMVYALDALGRPRGKQFGGCRLQPHAADPPPPPPPPPDTNWWEDVLEIAEDVTLVVVGAALLYTGNPVGLMLIVAGVADGIDDATQLSDDISANNGCFADWCPFDYDTISVAALLPRSVTSTLNADGTTRFMGIDVNTAPARHSLVDPHPQTTCADGDHSETHTRVEFPVMHTPLLFTAQEWTYGNIAPLADILLAVPGTGIGIAQTAQVLDQVPYPDVASTRAGTPDGVTFFDNRKMLYPRIWRSSARRTTAEQHVYLDPSAEFGFARHQLARLCANVTDCGQHRICGGTAGVPGCTTLPTPNCSASWRPFAWAPSLAASSSTGCSHPVHPVCVNVVMLAHEGVSLDERGTLYAAMSSDNATPVCVPITEKLVLDRTTLQSRFEEGHLWRRDCAYNPGRSDCTVPPATLAEAATDMNLQDMTRWLAASAPYALFSRERPAAVMTWGVGNIMTSADPDNSEAVHTEWVGQTMSLGSAHPVVEWPHAVGPNCGASNMAVDCGILIDNTTKVLCPRQPGGRWPGQCLKPALQLQTAAESETHMWSGPFDKHNALGTPVRAACPVYEPHAQDTATITQEQFPAVACRDWVKRKVPFTDQQSKDRARYVHYCEPYTADGVYGWCDNDHLRHTERAQLCGELHGSLLYTGLTLMEGRSALTAADVCNPATKTCYIVPGAHNLGGLGPLLKAAAAAFGPLDGYTFKATSVDVVILRQILFGATIEDMVVFNSPVAKPGEQRSCQTDPQQPPSPCLCCAGGECCTTCTKADIRIVNAGRAHNETVITGQGLFERSELIGRTLCNRAEPPTDDLFRNISDIERLWRQNGAYDPATDTFSVTGIDFPNHHSEAISHRMVYPASVFDTRIADTATVLIAYNNIRVMHIDPAKTVRFGQAKLVVRAAGFELINASFDGADKPLMFVGSTAENARVSHVSAPNAPVAVAFLGGMGVRLADEANPFEQREALAGVEVYSPFTSVTGVQVDSVTGAQFGVAFARTTGIATISGCGATLHNACTVDTPHGPCRTWATAYGGLRTRKGESWQLNASRHVVGPDGPLRVDGHAVSHEHGKLTAGSMCVDATDSHAVRVPCAAAPYATETAHLEGAPFFCFVAAGPQARYGVCRGCNVGLGRHTPCRGTSAAHVPHNATHCRTPNNALVVCTGCGLENAACPPRPVGHQILACTADPHGGVHTHRSAATHGIVPIPGGHGGLYDADAKRVVAAGYGYSNAPPDVVVHQILVEPAAHTDVFDIRTSSARVVNVSEYTAVFGTAYERAVYEPEMYTYPLVMILLALALCLLLALCLMHLSLVFKTEAAITALALKKVV